MKKILVTDDDIYIGNMLEEVLTKNGYAVFRAYSGTEAVMAVEAHKPDLILLDLMLPGLTGEEVLQRIKGISVIILSAKTDTENKIELLLGGAADYMTKPFDVNELLARITVQLRNSSFEKLERMEVGELSLDEVSHEVKVSGENVKLTKTEFAILKLLMLNPGQVIAKSVILDRISLDTPDCTESSLKQHVSNLRKKLRDAGDVDYIEAVWGIGFRFKTES